MPNISEIEPVLEALEKSAPTVRSFLDDLPEVFGSVGRSFSGSPVAEDVAARLFVMPKEAQMRPLLRAALGTDNPAALTEVRNFFHLPTEARTMLDGKEITRMTGLLRDNTQTSLGQFQDTMGALRDLSKHAAPDKSSLEILSAVRQSGVQGDNPWVGRNVSLASLA